MAIIYSYPHASPSLNDMVLGAKFKENGEITTNSFYIRDLINFIDTTTVVYNGSTPLDEEALNTLYPNAMIGFRVQGIDENVLTMYEKSEISYLWISYPITIA
jgi:hypothetical protein